MFSLNDIREGKVWVISDTHFGHKNIVVYANRMGKDLTGSDKHDYYYHNKVMQERWLERGVEEDDTVLHLGDVFFAGQSNDPADVLSRYVSHLPGHVIVTPLGNHDRKHEKKGIRGAGWDIWPALELHLPEGVIFFTHYPMGVDDIRRMAKGRPTLNLAGHIHQHVAPSILHIICCVEQPHIDYAPQPLNELIEGKFVDSDAYVRKPKPFFKGGKEVLPRLPQKWKVIDLRKEK